LKNPVPKIIAERVIILGKFEELLVIYSVKTKNFDELEKAYKRLRFYNEDLAKVINPSENYDKIAAIYLLYLLSFNRYISLRFELNP